MSTKDELWKEKKRLMKEDRDSRKLPKMANDPRDLKHENHICHGYVIIDCDSCMKALAERLKEY